MTVLMLLISISSLTTAQTKWYKYPGNPVFNGGEIGEWDHNLIAFVVLFEDDQFKMWYSAESLGTTVSKSLGYATSTNGINWEKYEGNPLEIKSEDNSWDTTLWIFDIIRKDSMYYMWYSAEPKSAVLTSNIGLAWSVDGLHWTKHPEPVLKPGDDAWDISGIGGPNVIFDGRRYHMWFNGTPRRIPKNCQIGYATSDDGFHWTKHPANPVLGLGKSGTWDDHWVAATAVTNNGSAFEIWYFGWDLIRFQIGLATSEDGIHCIKSAGNSVLKTGELGEWDASNVYGARVLIDDTIYRMWYLGNDNKSNRIGYATTSADEAKKWETARIDKPQREIIAQVFNHVEYIKVDSLTQGLSKLSGIDLINAYNKLALAYSLNDDAKSFYYAEKALELAVKKNYPEGKAMAYYSIGNCQYVMDNYSAALANQLSALRIFDSMGMLYEKGNLLLQIASIHTFTGAHVLAGNYQRQALEVFEKQQDTGYILLALNYLGYSYLQSGDTGNAIKVFQKRLSMAKKTENTWPLGETYEALGISYSGRSSDSSIHYFNEARSIWHSLSWSHLAYNYLDRAGACINFGPEYYREAEEYLEKCYDILLYKIIGDQHGQLRLCYGLAEVYFYTGRYDKAKEFLDLSLEICQTFLSKHIHQMYTSLNKKLENEISLKSYMENIYQLHYRLDTALNNEASAFKNYILATQWKDSIQDQQNRRQMAMLQGEYETESAQSQIAMLEKDNEVKNIKLKQSTIYLFVMGGFIMIIVLMAILFIRQNKIRAEHKTVVLEQKLLRLQMNPHFIFNALSNILNFINRKDVTNAANYLTSFSRLLRTTLESSREDFILLEEEISSLKNYIDLQLLRYEGKFDYSIDVDENIDIENAIIPPMLIQPFIENAIEHGIRLKQGKGHIYIRFRLVDKKVICEVEDDGVGREKAWETEYQKRKTHKSLATEIITDRIQSLNKKLKQKIKLNIIDLKTDNNEPVGTKVVLNIPYLID